MIVAEICECAYPVCYLLRHGWICSKCNKEVRD